MTEPKPVTGQIGVYMLSLIAPKCKDEVGPYHENGIAVYNANKERL